MLQTVLKSKLCIQTEFSVENLRLEISASDTSSTKAFSSSARLITTSLADPDISPTTTGRQDLMIPAFFKSNIFYLIAEVLLVIQSDARNHRTKRINHIGGIKASAPCRFPKLQNQLVFRQNVEPPLP